MTVLSPEMKTAVYRARITSEVSTSIYELTDPVHGIVFYVGQTSGLLEKRLEQHIYDALNGGRKDYVSFKSLWIWELIKFHNVMPLITRLERARFEYRNRCGEMPNNDVREVHWMLTRLINGYPLMNRQFLIPPYWAVDLEHIRIQQRANLMSHLKDIKDMEAAQFIMAKLKQSDNDSESNS